MIVESLSNGIVSIVISGDEHIIEINDNAVQVDINGVQSVTSTDNHIVVDNTDPENPTLSFQLVDNENLLTDDELAVVQATSGINTGDQDLSGLLQNSHLTDFNHGNIANGQTSYGWGNHASAGYELQSNKNQVGGYAGLDQSTGKISLSQIPDSLLGNVNFIGLWDALNNIPDLADSSYQIKGNYYIVTSAGTQFGIDFEVGDWAIFTEDSTPPQKVDNTDAVSSVDGQVGDVNLSNVYEPKNSNIQSHISSTSNPHSTTALQVGAEPAFGFSTYLDQAVKTTSSPTFAGVKTSKIIAGATGTNGFGIWNNAGTTQHLFYNESTGAFSIGTSRTNTGYALEIAGASGLLVTSGISQLTGGLAVASITSLAGNTIDFKNYQSQVVARFINNNFAIQTTTPTANFQVNQSTTGVGTVSVSAGGTVWTGVGTKFLNTFKVGDTITSEGQTLTIATIISDTSLTTNAVGAAISGKAYTLVGGTRFQVFGNGLVNCAVGIKSASYQSSDGSVGVTGTLSPGQTAIVKNGIITSIV